MEIRDKWYYIVRSGYHISLQQVLASNDNSVEVNWNQIWNIQAPPKVKYLLWRICRTCLPTRVRLHDRGVNCPYNCVLCDDGMEDNMHIIFQCSKIKFCWQHIDI